MLALQEQDDFKYQILNKNTVHKKPDVDKILKCDTAEGNVAIYKENHTPKRNVYSPKPGAIKGSEEKTTQELEILCSRLLSDFNFSKNKKNKRYVYGKSS